MKRICPNCETKYSWKKQIVEWIKLYGDEWEGEAMLMIVCPNCEHYCGEVFLEEAEYEIEEVESPALKEKVSVPIRKKK